MKKWERHFSALLRETLETRRQGDPKYSARRLAIDIGLSASALSHILRGSQGWAVKPLRAAEILKKLGLPLSRVNPLLEMLGESSVRPRDEQIPHAHEFLTNWLYPVVLLGHDLGEAKLKDPAALAKRFGVAASEVERVVQDLVRMDLLRVSPDGVLERSPRHWSGGDGPTPNALIRSHHAANLKTAMRALDEIPSEQRDFTSLTFTGSRRRMEEIRAEIRSLNERIMTLMGATDEGESNDELFRLSVCLFPLNFESTNGVTS